MVIDRTVFKEYDIRGRVQVEIDAEGAWRIGYAFAEFLARRYRKKRSVVLVCRDVRETSSALARALMKGIAAQGSHYRDAGVGTTPFFYYTMHRLKNRVDGGVMVTASHNPPQYNGFKMRDAEGKAISLNTGLGKIRDAALALPERVMPERAPGRMLDSPYYLSSYVNFLTRWLKFRRRVKIVVDASGGAACLFLPRVLARMPTIDCKALFFEEDGSFTKHSPNPLDPASQKHVKQELAKGGYDFGAIFDGDGDRVLFFDERGKFVRSEFVMGLLALEHLACHPKSAFVFTANASRGVREYLEMRGARVCMSRIGYVFVNEAMARSGAEYGVEISGHFYFRKFFSEDSGLFALLRLAALISHSGKLLSEMVKPFETYVSTGELNFSVADKRAALARVKKFYRSHWARISELDGITAEFPDWWFNLRPSNTEPLLRLVVEAKIDDLLRRKRQEVEKLIRS